MPQQKGDYPERMQQVRNDGYESVMKIARPQLEAQKRRNEEAAARQKSAKKTKKTTKRTTKQGSK
jgi:hypothetical protein